MNLRRTSKGNKPISARQKRAIDKAVKKTVKDYGKTLDMLAKT